MATYFESQFVQEARKHLGRRKKVRTLQHSEMVQPRKHITVEILPPTLRRLMCSIVFARLLFSYAASPYACANAQSALRCFTFKTEWGLQNVPDSEVSNGAQYFVFLNEASTKGWICRGAHKNVYTDSTLRLWANLVLQNFNVATTPMVGPYD